MKSKVIVAIVLSAVALMAGDKTTSSRSESFSISKDERHHTLTFTNFEAESEYSVSVGASGGKLVSASAPSGIMVTPTDQSELFSSATATKTAGTLPDSFNFVFSGYFRPEGEGEGEAGSDLSWDVEVGTKFYYIKSNQEDGEKEIVVPAGTSVTYTAYEGANTKNSNWSVNGQSKNNENSIIFNRNWWDVPGWFSASMGTPDPGIYNISASPADNASKSDSGVMTVAGVGSISGGGKHSTKNNASEITNNETIWIDSATSNNVTLTADIVPYGTSWPANTPEWNASCGFWCLLGDHFSGNTKGQTTVNVTTSSPDVLNVWAECGSSKKYIKIIAYKVDFQVSKDNLTLKHDNESVFTITAEPSSVFSETNAPVVQIKRTGIGATDWLDLMTDTGEINWTARVAGVFKLRLKTKINESDYTSPERDLAVNFPTYAQIIADSTVRTRMNSEWQATLNDCTDDPNRRRERGFWISLNTAGDGSYSCGDSILGRWVDPATDASIALGERPHSSLSSVAPNAASGTYTVSSFHTHTPMTYRALGGSRTTGPSGPDRAADLSDNVAGIVYDYTAESISSGHSKNAPAGTHRSRNQRSLTAE